MNDLPFRLRRNADALDGHDYGHTIAIQNAAALEIERLEAVLADVTCERDRLHCLAVDWMDRANKWRALAEHLAERQSA